MLFGSSPLAGYGRTGGTDVSDASLFLCLDSQDHVGSERTKFFYKRPASAACPFAPSPLYAVGLKPEGHIR